MEQAETKHCPKSGAGEEHERHSWLDKDGLHSCDGDILSADEQECIDLKMLLTKFGERIEKAVSKMFGKVDKINAR